MDLTNELAPTRKQLVPAPKVAQRYNVTRRTLGRWIVDKGLGFPRPIAINNRLYFAHEELEAFDRIKRVGPGQAA